MEIVIIGILIIIGIIGYYKYSQHKKIYAKLSEDLKIVNSFTEKLKDANTLNDLFILNKLIINHLYKYIPPSLFPDKFGVFRTDDLKHLSKDEIFLGDVYGIWTKTLKEFEKIDDKQVISIVTNQYYHLIFSGLLQIKENIIKLL